VAFVIFLGSARKFRLISGTGIAHERQLGKIGRGNGTEFFWEEHGLGSFSHNIVYFFKCSQTETID